MYQRPKPLLFPLPFPQVRKHLVRTALRKTMLLGEIQGSHRIGLYDRPRLDEEPTLGCRNLLPKNPLTRGEMHVAPQLGRNGLCPRSVMVVVT